MPNSPLSRFRKEQALRRAGVEVSPYPTGSGVETAVADAKLLSDGTVWEREMDKRYVQFLTAKAAEMPIDDAEDYIYLA